MKLPTNPEIDEALKGFDADGPLPFAAVVDGHPDLARWVATVVARYAVDEQLVKTGLVLGLNLGIRIGESRRK